MNIIGIAGAMASGKSTVAAMLVSRGYVEISFADPIKRFCMDVFDWTEEQLWGPSELRNEEDRRYLRLPARDFTERDTYLSPRHALQQLGTEWGRGCYKNLWSDYAIGVAKKLLDETHVYSRTRGFERAVTECGGVVISDCRFESEVRAIVEAGGRVWLIDRPPTEAQYVMRSHDHYKMKCEPVAHASERLEIDSSLIARTIVNDGSLDELAAKVEEAL